jgi:hypothetical protein
MTALAGRVEDWRVFFATQDDKTLADRMLWEEEHGVSRRKIAEKYGFTVNEVAGRTAKAYRLREMRGLFLPYHELPTRVVNTILNAVGDRWPKAKTKDKLLAPKEVAAMDVEVLRKQDNFGAKSEMELRDWLVRHGQEEAVKAWPPPPETKETRQTAIAMALMRMFGDRIGDAEAVEAAGRIVATLNKRTPAV